MTTGIYGIRHRETGRIYVGKCRKSIEQRWKEHISRLRRGAHHCKALQRFWNEYGEDAFEYIVLERIGLDASETFYRLREQRWKEYYQWDVGVFNKRNELRETTFDEEM